MSVCDKGENRNSHATQTESLNSIADQSKSILLQTARAEVFNIETKSSVKTQILFDTGSQRCYVNKKIRKSENYSYRENINRNSVKLMNLKCKL